ncbi:MAG: caspase family protein [Caldilineaceae bacterium]
MSTPNAFELTAAQSVNSCSGFTRSLAVVIGINDYANGVPRLATPVNDATRLAHLLATEHGYDVCLVVQEATKAQLTTLFREQVPAAVGPNDRLLVYFAGHGIALDGEDGPVGFLIPQDAHPEDRNTFLAMTDIHDALINLPCRHLLAILDCCFAGAFRWSATRHLRPAMPEILHKERYDRFVRDPAWQVITSAAYDQRALDILAGNVVGKRDVVESQHGQHSPFALALFAALNGAGDLIPKGGGDGVITAAELYLYLRDYVEIGAEAQLGHYQTPGIWPLRRHGKGEYIFLAPGHALNLPPAPPLTAERNPYRGLQPYDEAHADLFFGRAALIQQLATLVQAQPLTVILGASGTGKSSLVRAGLAPYLKQQVDQQAFEILAPLRPGDMPLRLLADRIASALNEGAPLQPTPAAIVQLLEQWLALHPIPYLLLIIDQFEELITLCRDQQECTQFLELLATLVQQHGNRVRIILTLRTDFEPQFTDSPLAPYWHTGPQAARFVVPPLTQAELRQVIEEPAAQRVLFFDPATLVDQLVDEVSQTPGALPLLSFTLSELYLKYLKRQEEAQLAGETIERSLTEADYRALGGVIGSLRTRADEVYDGLDAAHQLTMQRVMLRMVAIEGGELARRRVLITELEYGTEEENHRVSTIIDQMVAARLLVYGGGADIDGDNVPDNYIEPAHDALVRAWDKLLVWKKAADEYLPLQRRLTRASQEWRHASAADKAGLLWNNDPGLPQLLPEIIKQAELLDAFLNPGQSIWPSLMAEGAPAWLNKSENEFVAASVKQRATLRRRVTLITTAVFLGLLGLTIYAFTQNNLAQRRAKESQSLALASNAQQAIQDHDHDLAIALALQANAIKDPLELAINGLAAAAYVPGTKTYFALHQDEISHVALSTDGRTALSAALDRRVLLWDVATQEILQQLDAQQVVTVTQVAYSPSGDTALLGSADGAITIWDLNSGEIRQRLRSDRDGEVSGAISALAYSTDGQMALSGDSTGALTLWDVAAGTLIRTLGVHPDGVSAVALSPDGRTALSGGDNADVMLWNLADGELLRTIQELNGRVLAVAYDPTASYIIAGSTDYIVRAWRLTTGQRIGGVNLSAHTQSIGSIAIAPDGVTVASGAWDGSIRLWDLQVNAEIGSLVGHRAPVISLAFSQDSRSLLSGSRDSTVRLWDIRGPAQLRHYLIERRLPGTPFFERADNLAIDAAGQTALSGDWDGIVRWRLDSGAELQRFELSNTPAVVRNALIFQVEAHDPAVGNQDGDGIERVAMSVLDDTGKMVWQKEEKQPGYCAFGGGAPDCGVWWFIDHRNRWPSIPDHPGDPIHSGHYTLRAVVYATTGVSKTLESPVTIQLSSDFQTAPGFTAVATAQTTVSGSPALVAAIVKTGRVPHGPFTVALSPNEPWALYGADSDLIEWNWETGAARFLAKGHDDQIITIAYDAAGRTALSAARDGMIIQWDLATGQPLWQRKLPQAGIWSITFDAAGTRAVSGAEDHSVILWDLATGAALQHFVGHQDAVYAVAISPDQTQLLTAAADRRVILWDLATGQEIRRFEGHSLPVHTVAFSADGHTLLSGGEDQTVRLWNRETGAEMFRFEGHASTIQKVRYLPDGTHLLSRANDGDLLLWQMPITNATELVAWTTKNRYVRPLTCDERLLYNVAPLCQDR